MPNGALPPHVSLLSLWQLRGHQLGAHGCDARQAVGSLQGKVGEQAVRG